jgi:alpha-glucosidase
MMPLPTWLQSIHHDGSERYVSDPTPRLGQTIRLRLRTGLDAPLRRVFLRNAPDGEQAFTALHAGQVDAAARWWETEVAIHQPLMHYRFALEADDGVWWLNAAGAGGFDPLDANDFKILAGATMPEWLYEAIFYQIFPDRFANGNPANDPQPTETTYRGHGPQTFPWGTLPPDDTPFPLVFYGGDLEGVAQKLAYIADLGATALYLNPVFTAQSNHKYDVIDYEHVDRHFGGDEALIALRQALDTRSMRYLLDIVPNHSGYWHPWFQAALADAAAPEAEFYTFTRHPEEYASWLGVWILPKLNYRSAELRRRMYEGDGSIFRRWLQPPYSADGWRVDVANMLGRQGASQLGTEVARGIRQAVKAEQPDAYLMGENFFDATPQLQGDQFDGVMNYMGFAKPLLNWLRGYRQGAWGMAQRITSPLAWPTAAMAATWQSRLAAIPWTIALQQYNLLSSHDTERVHSQLHGDEALHQLAVTLLMTFPGVPGVYYGDEIGMTDLPSLGSRGCMIWDERKWNRSLQETYRRLIALRKQSAALQRGGFQLLTVEVDTVAYQREVQDERLLVIAHRGAQPRPAEPLPVAHGGIEDGARFIEAFTGKHLHVESGCLPLDSHPQGASVWKQVG